MEVVHVGVRTFLDHVERDVAGKRRVAIPGRALSMPSPWEVLVIEDDQLDRSLVAELLAVRSRGGVRLTEVPDLQAGLQALATRRFDLVLLDTKLPDASALHALRAVGEIAPLTPILPHPAYITAQTRHTARQRGTFDVVVRGDLNPMWAAVNKLLTLSALGADPRPSAHVVGQ